MNLRPPPKNPTLADLEKYCNDLYEFLQKPDFELLKLNSRSSAPTGESGLIYFDGDGVYVSGVKVVGSQQTHIADASAGTEITTINAIIDALEAFGILATS